MGTLAPELFVDNKMIRVEKYKGGRNWAVYVGETLLAVCVYKKGANAVKAALEGKT